MCIKNMSCVIVFNTDIMIVIYQEDLKYFCVDMYIAVLKLEFFCIYLIMLFFEICQEKIMIMINYD